MRKGVKSKNLDGCDVYYFGYKMNKGIVIRKMIMKSIAVDCL